MSHDKDSLQEPGTERGLWPIALIGSLAFNAAILATVAPGTLWRSGGATIAPAEQREAMRPPPESQRRVASLPIDPAPPAAAPRAVIDEPPTLAVAATPQPPEPSPAVAPPKPRPRPAAKAEKPRRDRTDPSAVPAPEPAPPPVVAMAPPPPEPVMAPMPQPEPPAQAPQAAARQDDFLPPNAPRNPQLALGPFRMTVPSWQPLPSAMKK